MLKELVDAEGRATPEKGALLVNSVARYLIDEIEACARSGAGGAGDRSGGRPVDLGSPGSRRPSE